MIAQFKAEFEQAAAQTTAIFECLSISELEDYAQNYDFTNPLIRLEPILKVTQNILPSGAIRYNATIKLYFLTKFQSDDNKEETKDILIDQMIALMQSYYEYLNLNNNRLFINPSWTWSTDILRQYTSNLLCGCVTTIELDTACNRL